MKKYYSESILIIFALLSGIMSCQNNNDSAQKQQASETVNQLQTPAEMYGQLLYDAQLSHVFEDGKTFVDCIPKVSPDSIMKAYNEQRQSVDFDIKSFVNTYFDLPKSFGEPEEMKKLAISEHINQLWRVLERPADSVTYGTRIRLKHPYVVPGGRFREIYYWDSYFTMLGLEISQEHELIEGMVRNFADMIDELGFIPNGSRTYFLGRSQPPFFSLMVDILAKIKGDEVYKTYLPQLEKEYAFWMKGSQQLTSENSAISRSVLLDSKYVLNRYWDNFDGPREESLAEDVEVQKESGREEKTMYRNLRAGAESGWDYSSRWFADGHNMTSIETIDIIPVDLNALLYQLETSIAKAYRINGQRQLAAEFDNKAENRKIAINTYCWSEKNGFYQDYQFKKKQHTDILSLAGVYPLCFRLATDEQAEKVAQYLKENFLKDGGLTTTLNNTSQQWDAPNGWAPLQWMGYWGMKNYEKNDLTTEIATKWTKLNEDVFSRTGKMTEKYNVMDISLEGGGGEYPLQDGFGWTNGVYLKLKSELDSLDL